MSAAPPPPPPAAAVPNEITVVSHCSLFYWWPVWAVGFIMFGLTYWDHKRMVIVPESTKVELAVTGTASSPRPPEDNVPQLPKTIAFDQNDVLILPKDYLPKDKDHLKLHAAKSKDYGVLFATTLLLVIVITNVPLRGGWSFAIIVFAILIAIILALAHKWDEILDTLSLLDIRINAGGYLFISSILFGIWLITILVFDRRIYMTFTPGQMRVCTEIGGGEKVYSTAGMALEKQRSDLFRHWVLGLGSGDLIVKTAGAQAHDFDLHNVLFIGKKVKQIEGLMKRVVVQTR